MSVSAKTKSLQRGLERVQWRRALEVALELLLADLANGNFHTLRFGHVQRGMLSRWRGMDRSIVLEWRTDMALKSGLPGKITYNAVVSAGGVEVDRSFL